MESRACVLHSEKDLRIESVPVADMADDQVLVRIGAGGICGSDLHYYLDGGFGVVRVKQPIVLGHEVAGTVEAVGAKVTKVKPGDRIALNPSRPCGKCKFCLAGEQQHCLDMWFYGSAMRIPHSQGAFRELIVVGEFQCEPVGVGAPPLRLAASDGLLSSSICRPTWRTALPERIRAAAREGSSQLSTA